MNQAEFEVDIDNFKALQQENRGSIQAAGGQIGMTPTEGSPAREDHIING